MERSISTEPSKFMPTQFGALVELLTPLSTTAKSFEGRHMDELLQGELPSELKDLAHTTAVSEFHLRRWMTRILSRNDQGLLEENPNWTSIRVNLEYLSLLRGLPRTELEDQVAYRLDKNTGPQGFISSLYQAFPLSSAVTLLLYDHFRSSGTKGKKRSKSWYEKVIDTTVETDELIHQFMRKLQYRQQSIVGNPLAEDFLVDMERDIRLHGVELINTANTYAVYSANRGVDGILAHGMRVGISASDFPYAVEEIKSLDRTFENGRSSAYNSIAGGISAVNDRLSPGDREVVVPIITGSFDVLRYSSFWHEMWKDLNDGLDTDSPYRDTARDPRTTAFNIGRRGSLFMRAFPQTEPGNSREARIALQFGDLSMRVDCDNRRQQLSFDFGRTTFERALDYAECILRVDEIAPVEAVMSSHRETHRFRDTYGFGPSFMEPYGEKGLAYGWKDPFSDSDKMALMSSIVASGGENMGIRRNVNWFGYHMREYVNKYEYLEKFPLIVYSLSRALSEVR